MRIKRATVLFGFLITIFILFTLYCAKDLNKFSGKKGSDLEYNKWVHFEDRIKRLEKVLNKHNDAVQEIQAAVNVLRPTTPSKQNLNRLPPQPVSEVIIQQHCNQIKYTPKVDLQMLELYKEIKFDNPDGGAWKQGWRIEVDEKDWNRHNKLKVFVVPHSHNDPGWVKTLEEYYTSQTKRILNNMVEKLPEDPRRKFIWAEISYFSMWWNDINQDQRDAVKRLLRDNQLEIVTGGWVMNDEANSHYASIINQIFEGHQWLQQNLNYTPRSSWSIDPFGMSTTQPYLLKMSGMEHMLIQRTHYSVKKRLASTQDLEFRWRQPWDEKGHSEIFTHMMPFYSYDIPHTCGPDPKVCCQFDFKRLPYQGLSCPWKVPPQPISEKNVAERAEMLLDQYRKKSKLYKTNVVLAPLGDDFRYDHPTEWDVQYENYQKLFDYMNNNLNLNVQAQFGTLSDYFSAVLKEKKLESFKTLSGDFFTYADRDDHYWSGYYTSRPFYKRMDRVLLSYIKAADAIQALAHLSGKIPIMEAIDKMLTDARRALSLFQHHDGVTGTAKDYVMVDYAKKMLLAIKNCQKVIQLLTNILLEGPDSASPVVDVAYYQIDDVRHSHDALPEQSTITIGIPDIKNKKIVIYNPMTFTRIEVVTFYISTPFVEVLDHKNKRIHCQLSPIFEYGSSMSQTKYQLSFIVNIPALSLLTYTINALYEDETPEETAFASIRIYNQYNEVASPKGFDAEVFPNSGEFTLQNSRVTASFNKFGLLKALKAGTDIVPVHLDFAKYGVRARGNTERSGAYLFLPDGEATPLNIENVIVNVIEGPIMSVVTVQLPYVNHIVRLFDSPGGDSLGLEIENTVDISKTSNFEIAMRLSTNLDSKDVFFTDLNGFEMLRRVRFKKLPLQANYYPMPTMAYIEDDSLRLTLATGTALGVSSLNSGQLEVMLDRRLNQDDNLGLGQGVLDNKPTKHIFRVLLEKRTHSCKTTESNHPSGFPTLSAYVASQTLLNPLIKLLRNNDDDTLSKNIYTGSKGSLGVDLSFPLFRKHKEGLAVVIHRQLIDVCFADRILLQQFGLSPGTVDLRAVLPISGERKVREASLSFNKEKGIVKNETISICPMDMIALIL